MPICRCLFAWRFRIGSGHSPRQSAVAGHSVFPFVFGPSASSYRLVAKKSTPCGKPYQIGQDSCLAGRAGDAQPPPDSLDPFQGLDRRCRRIASEASPVVPCVPPEHQPTALGARRRRHGQVPERGACPPAYRLGQTRTLPAHPAGLTTGGESPSNKPCRDSVASKPIFRHSQPTPDNVPHVPHVPPKPVLWGLFSPGSGYVGYMGYVLKVFPAYSSSLNPRSKP